MRTPADDVTRRMIGRANDHVTTRLASVWGVVERLRERVQAGASSTKEEKEEVERGKKGEEEEEKLGGSLACTRIGGRRKNGQS